jgi:hypothetical protein
VAEIVEADLADVRGSQRGVEALQQLGAIDRLAGLGVGEDEVIVVRPPRLLREQLEFVAAGGSRA